MQDAKVTVVVPGVELTSLVGEHNGARDLFTGLLTLAPQILVSALHANLYRSNSRACRRSSG